MNFLQRPRIKKEVTIKEVNEEFSINGGRDFSLDKSGHTSHRSNGQEEEDENQFLFLLSNTVEGIEVYKDKFMSRKPKYYVDSEKWKASYLNKQI
jgi:hypothetical protein